MARGITVHDKDIVEVYFAASPQDAYLMKNFLENAGIQATVVGEPLESVAGVAVGPIAGPRVWVAQADSKRAQEIIERWHTERRTGGASCSTSPWACPNCGQEVPGDFDVCWKDAECDR